jgi:threonylcarbamoyladenosine tRNA methylthiotransferase MtaB
MVLETGMQGAEIRPHRMTDLELTSTLSAITPGPETAEFSAGRIAFHTLGCKLNFAETGTIARSCQSAGWELVDFQDPAEVYVVNTCSVTERADKDCRKLVRQIRRRAPGAEIVLMGCYVQLKPEEAREQMGVDLILGADEKFDLITYLSHTGNGHEQVIQTGPVEELETFRPSLSLNERTRAYLKVQDGCDYSCTYCSIPRSRGRSRNLSVAETIAQAQSISDSSARELVLTGVNIGDFGQQGEESFLDLLKALEELSGIERIRVSSIEPNLLTDAIIEHVALSSKILPHFHVPLQSGSNKILRAMARRYQRELYADRVRVIKDAIPDCCIGVDVIVGFPGETDTDFEDTYQFLVELEVSYLHVFSYSRRPFTAAVEFPGQVRPEERARRSRELRKLSDQKRRSFHRQFLDTVRPVLFETVTNGFISGYTDNYIRVSVPGTEDQLNCIESVKLTGVKDLGMGGKIVI